MSGADRWLVVAIFTATVITAGPACVPPPPGMVDQVLLPQRGPTPVGIFPGLDPGGKEVSGLHFQVRAYGTPRADEVLRQAEEQYERIMRDTGLYSFQPRGLYSIVVYGSSDEYRKKTQQAQWSGGVTVGNAIYTYDSPGLPMILAHEMTHLIFHEYMAPPRAEHRWLNEGLAVYEEQEVAVALGLVDSQAAEVRRLMRAQPLSFEQMRALVAATERERSISQWYQQVGDVVRFMVDRGGRNGFSAFLRAVRDGRGWDEAVRSAFPGVWDGLPGLESAWLRR